MIMDILASLEPQLAFPVVFAVVFAFLVYLFGFQKTQEPNFEKLALLQESKSHKSQVKHKQQTQSVSTKKTSKQEVSKPVANGHAVHDKDKNVSSPKARVVLGKENKPPTTPQQKTKGKKDNVTTPEEDINAGDWTSVPTRKEKKTRKEERRVEDRVESPKPTSRNQRHGHVAKNEKDEVDYNKSSPSAAVDTVDEPEEKVFSVEEIIQMANAQGKKLDLSGLSPTPSPKPQREKKVKAKAPGIPEIKEKEEVKEKEIVKPAAAPEEPKKTPKKAKAPVAPAPVLEKKKEAVVVEKKKEEPPTIKISEAKKLVEQEQPKEKVVQNGGGDSNESKSNVVFDEIGDTWEEAKSRGAKKRRARKD